MSIQRQRKASRARDAWRAYERTAPNSSKKQIALRWEAMWSASDFSWAGLADAGWELGENASPAQKLKRWRAPPDFPNNAEGEGKMPTGATAKASRWKKATVQDYWRWSFGVGDGPTRLLTDEELEDLGLLVADERGVLWHLLHSSQTASNAALLTAIGIPVDDESVAELDAAFGRPLQDKSALVPIIHARLKNATPPDFKMSPVFTTEFASFVCNWLALASMA